MKRAVSSLLGSSLLAAGLTIASTVLTASAQAATFGFQNIVPSDPGETIGDPFVGQFKFDVTDLGGGQVKFTLNNTGAAGTNPFIGGVYFDDNGGLLSGISLNFGNTGVVDFKESNGAFAQGNKISFEREFGATKDGAASNGVQGGEALGIRANGNYAGILSALNTGGLRLGIHVQGLPDGASDSYVSAPPTTPPVTKPVPEPATLAGLGLVAGAIAASRRRRASQSA
jgi:PEP-CTERM motif